MKTIKMQVTHNELCWMLEGMDQMLKIYYKVPEYIKDIEKTRAHIVRKLLMMERRERREREVKNDAT